MPARVLFEDALLKTTPPMQILAKLKGFVLPTYTRGKIYYYTSSFPARFSKKAIYQLSTCDILYSAFKIINADYLFLVPFCWKQLINMLSCFNLLDKMNR
jgi:hypothetical protein